MQATKPSQLNALLASPDGERYAEFLFAYGVKGFQEQHGLAVDGIVGPKTLAAIATGLADGHPAVAPVTRPFPQGKGMFIRALSQAGTPAQACSTARWAGIRWVAIQRCWQYSTKSTQTINGRSLEHYAEALRKAGLEVWLWGFGAPGKHEEFVDLLVTSARQCEARGVILDAEKPFYARRHADAARAFMDALLATAHGHGLAVGFTSYGSPAAHPKFPWKSFVGADFGVPQIYEGKGKQRADYPKRAVEQWRRLGFPAILPASAAYRHGAAAMRDLLARTPVPDGGIVWWDWHNCSQSTERWDVVTQYRLPAPATA